MKFKIEYLQIRNADPLHKYTLHNKVKTLLSLGNSCFYFELTFLLRGTNYIFVDFNPQLDGKMLSKKQYFSKLPARLQDRLATDSLTEQFANECIQKLINRKQLDLGYITIH